MARNGHTSSDRNTIRVMCYFYQWMYWRTRDPEVDAIRGHHDRQQPPPFDLLSELGKLRRKLRASVGDELLKSEDWLASMAEHDILSGLPKPHLGTSRLTQKTAPPAPELGPRPGTKPSDWARGIRSKGILMKKRPATEGPKGAPGEKKSRK